MSDNEHDILAERRRRRKQLSDILQSIFPLEHLLIPHTGLERYCIQHERISLENEPKPRYFVPYELPAREVDRTYPTFELDDMPFSRASSIAIYLRLLFRRYLPQSSNDKLPGVRYREFVPFHFHPLHILRPFSRSL